MTNGIDANSVFDSAWRAALDRQAGAGPGPGAGDALSEAFDRANEKFTQSFEAATNAASRSGAVSTGEALGIDAGSPGRPDATPMGGDTVDAIRTVDGELKSADTITQDLLAGRIDSPHEVAARVRRADLTLRYSLEIRNRLVDAYREVMRMSV